MLAITEKCYSGEFWMTKDTEDPYRLMFYSPIIVAVITCMILAFTGIRYLSYQKEA